MFHPKCGAMSKSKYLVHCKNFIQLIIFKNIISEPFDIITNSRLLLVLNILFYLKIKIIYLNEKKFEKTLTNKFYLTLSDLNFLEKKIGRKYDLKKTYYLDWLDHQIDLYDHFICFNKFTLINSIILHLLEKKKKPFSVFEIDNLKNNYKIEYGYNIKYDKTYSIAFIKNKIFKIFNFIIDNIILSSNNLFQRGIFIYNIVYLFNSSLGFALNKLVLLIFNNYFKLIKKIPKKLVILQCSHDSSILCKTNFNKLGYLKYFLKNTKNSIICIHPEERDPVQLLKIIVFSFKNNNLIIVSIKPLIKTRKKITEISTLSSSALLKLKYHL